VSAANDSIAIGDSAPLQVQHCRQHVVTCDFVIVLSVNRVSFQNRLSVEKVRQDGRLCFELLLLVASGKRSPDNKVNYCREMEACLSVCQDVASLPSLAFPPEV
jgi:hypothetical protein